MTGLTLRIQSSKSGATTIAANAARGLFPVSAGHGPLTFRLESDVDFGVCWDGYAERGPR